MGLTDEDLRRVEIFIMCNPNGGDVLQGTGGAVKLRWALPSNSKGKRGGIRIIYVDVKQKAHVHLLLCYPKNKQENLTSEQKKELKQLIKAIKGE
jgi:hypothetical protein